MNKIFRLFLLILIVFTLVSGTACGKKAASNSRQVSPTPSVAAQQKETDTPVVTQKETDVPAVTQKETATPAKAQEESITPVVTQKESSTPVVAQKEEKPEVQEQSPTEAAKNETPSTSTGYQGLTGEALVKAVLQRTPEKLFVVTESISGTVKSTSISYMVHDFIRNEADSDEGKQVMIYNPDEEMTYTYNEDIKTGMKFSDGEDAAEQGGLINEDDYEDFEGLISAELTSLNGEEVIYLVAVIDEDGVSSETRTWVSTKFKYPVATEIYYNGTLAVKSRVLEISDDFKVDDTLFIVPDDIQFIDFDDFNFLEGMEGLVLPGE